MPVRVMHVVNNLGKGGLENGLVNLIGRLDPARFEHIVCTVRGLGPNADRLPADRTRIVNLGERGANSRVQTPSLMRVMRQFRPDIVHSRNWGAIEAVIAGRLAGRCAVVHSEHGFEAEASAKEPVRRVYMRRMAFELAHRVLTVSFQLRDQHAARTGFPASRMTVIHNGVDGVRFCPDAAIRTRVRRDLGLADSEFCIGCVANLLPVKDHMTLLTGVASMAAGVADWRLLLVGEGPERTKLEALVSAEPALTGRVSFLGSSNRVPDLLRAMDVFVLPSVAEGICNSLLEAMSSGVPVIATAVGGNPEVVIDGASGLLFSSGDARGLADRLTRLRRDDRLRTELARGGVERVRDQFSMGAMARAYEQLYMGTQAAADVPAVSAG
jgi:sugar transferase (PEP-CTERM/EpsH1 system associated)